VSTPSDKPPRGPRPLRTRAANEDASQAQAPADATQAEIYKKREKIYPREVHGIFATLRWAAVFGLLGLYYGLPWLRWDGRQAVLFDLPERKFHLFGLTLWPQDFFLLALLLMAAGFALFLFTAVAGRLWCGYACPQTVWTEVFLWMERLVEGNRNRQIKLDKSSGLRKWRIKITKHALWIAFSLWTGLTFVGYFTPITELGPALLSFQAGPWETFWVLFYGFATYGNAGWMREQVCIYMCPYARFQSAMFDKNTLIISYDEERGDPRGSRRREEDHKAKGLGDCIDCGLCKQVCPTGIDIRDGLQYQCIGCAACVDVCDEVMDKMGYPRGLVRYTTENALAGTKTRVLRPRIFVYVALLVVLFSAVSYGLLTRTPLELDIIRDRNSLYRETREGLVENIYTLKLINMSDQAQRYALSVGGLPGIELGLIENNEVVVPAGEVLSFAASVRVDPVELDRASAEVLFSVQSLDDPALRITETARFIGPVTR
jgi:cytochrome c oxidase accessory protein FixG